MNAHPLHTYLIAQGELGGFEVVLPLLSEPLSEPESSGFKDLQELPKQVLGVEGQNDLLWKDATDINAFYEALKKHSIYTKAMRSMSFCAPKEIKTNAPLLLLFHSPMELTAEARDILDRLFKKLGIDLNMCAISFFLKCKDAALPREKNILKEMLLKEIELLNPEKIIFFREAPKPEKIETPVPISGNTVTFASKPALTLYSLLEMLPDKPYFKEKMNEVLSICQAQISLYGRDG
jgi:hypothetical protein